MLFFLLDHHVLPCSWRWIIQCCLLSFLIWIIQCCFLPAKWLLPHDPSAPHMIQRWSMLQLWFIAPCLWINTIPSNHHLGIKIVLDPLLASSNINNVSPKVRTNILTLIQTISFVFVVLFCRKRRLEDWED
jgi:hypothetical protein